MLKSALFKVLRQVVDFAVNGLHGGHGLMHGSSHYGLHASHWLCVQVVAVCGIFYFSKFGSEGLIWPNSRYSSVKYDLTTKVR